MSNKKVYDRLNHEAQAVGQKGRMMDIAIKQFALKGFRGTTMGDIAEEMGLQIGSLYRHYDSKEALITDVIKRFEAVHRYYNTWLRGELEKAETVEEAMDALFNEHFVTEVGPTGRQLLSIAMKEQHNSTEMYRSLLKTVYTEGIGTIAEGFDKLILKGVIPRSDTYTLATIFMFNVLAINNVHIHEETDTLTPFDRLRLYEGLRAMIAASLLGGVIPEE